MSGIRDAMPSTAAPVVVKLGGALLSNAAALASVAQSLALFHAGHPGQLIIVHGGGIFADKLLEDAGIVCPKHRGLRATPPAAIEYIVAAFRDQANLLLCNALQAHEVPNQGGMLTDHSLVKVTPKLVPDFDLGLVGTPSPSQAEPIMAMLACGTVPVLCSLGMHEALGVLNINADEAAGVVAAAIGARAILLLSDVPGVLNTTGECFSELSASQIESLVSSGVIHSGMLPKVAAAQAAASAAGCPAIIAGWNQPNAIQNALSGNGTRILTHKEAASV